MSSGSRFYYLVPLCAVERDGEKHLFPHDLLATVQRHVGLKEARVRLRVASVVPAVSGRTKTGGAHNVSYEVVSVCSVKNEPGKLKSLSEKVVCMNRQCFK
jgi:hypothetical protein